MEQQRVMSTPQLSGQQQVMSPSGGNGDGQIDLHRGGAQYGPMVLDFTCPTCGQPDGSYACDACGRFIHPQCGTRDGGYTLCRPCRVGMLEQFGEQRIPQEAWVLAELSHQRSMRIGEALRTGRRLAGAVGSGTAAVSGAAGMIIGSAVAASARGAAALGRGMAEGAAQAWSTPAVEQTGPSEHYIGDADSSPGTPEQRQE